MAYHIEMPFSIPEHGFDNLVYVITVDEIKFWGVFARAAESLHIDEIEAIHKETGVRLGDESVTFKFDRKSNIDRNDFYAPKQFPRLSRSGLKDLGLAIVKCFELHHNLSGATEYYAFALDNKLGRFYTSLADEHAEPLGFKAKTQAGDGDLFVFKKMEV
jgi:hypothetical protein